MIKRICLSKPLWLILLIWAALLSGCMFAADSNPVGLLGTSWKEEVLLHDGRIVVVKRSLKYGGRHEIGQPEPIKEQTITFNLPDSKKTVSWTSEYSEDVGRANFKLLAVHVLNDIPYVAATPNLCLSYNKWGRPNPPYVFFKFNGKDWQRLSLEEFPIEFKTINVAIYLGGRAVDKMSDLGLVPVEHIQKSNRELQQPEYKAILRDPLEKDTSGSIVTCEELIWYGCGWGAPGEFNRKYFEQTCK